LEGKRRLEEEEKVDRILGSNICAEVRARLIMEKHCLWPKELNLMFDIF